MKPEKIYLLGAIICIICAIICRFVFNNIQISNSFLLSTIIWLYFYFIRKKERKEMLIRIKITEITEKVLKECEKLYSKVDDDKYEKIVTKKLISELNKHFHIIKINRDNEDNLYIKLRMSEKSRAFTVVLNFSSSYGCFIPFLVF